MVARSALPASGTGSGPTRSTRSGRKLNRAWLVTSSFSCSQASSKSVRRAAASRTCSKLSTTSTSGMRSSQRMRAAASGCPGSVGTSSWAAISAETSPGSGTFASETIQTEPGRATSRAHPTSNASRVLPTPLRPVKVTKRTDGSSSSSNTAANSTWRPMSGAACSERCSRTCERAGR